MTHSGSSRSLGSRGLPDRDLLHPQRRQRIDPGRSPRRNPGRGRSDEHDNERDDRRQAVNAAIAVGAASQRQKPDGKQAEREASHQARETQLQAAPHEQADNVPVVRTERGTNADLAYALRYRKRDVGYSALFLIIGVTLLVLLFTESRATRTASALVLAASIARMFMYAFVRQRRARAERRS